MSNWAWKLVWTFDISRMIPSTGIGLHEIDENNLYFSTFKIIGYLYNTTVV